MGFVSFMVSVLPTVGKVVGALINAFCVNHGVLYYSFKSPNASGENGDEGGAVFLREDGQYKLYNSNLLENQVISISFLGRENSGTEAQCAAESYALPGRSTLVMNDLFKTYADNDNSRFELASTVDDGQTSGENDGSCYVQMTALQKGVVVAKEPETARLGSYLGIKLGVDSVVISGSDTAPLDSVVSLSIKGSGDTTYKLRNMTASSNQVTVSLPEPLLEGDACEIEIAGVLKTASATSLSKNHHGLCIEKVAQDKHDAIMGATRLNWPHVKE